MKKITLSIFLLSIFASCSNLDSKNESTINVESDTLNIIETPIVLETDNVEKDNVEEDLITNIED